MRATLSASFESLPQLVAWRADNWKPSNKKSRERIDGIVALIMGLDRALRQEGPTSVYDKGGPYFIIVSDAVNLPPGTIDVAFICDTYHHFDFPHKTMRSIHEALKPGGVVILIDFQRIEGVSSECVRSHVRDGQEVFAKGIRRP